MPLETVKYRDLAGREDQVDWRSAPQVAAWMTQAYEDGKQRKQTWERRMAQNTLFVNGQQYSTWDTTRHLFATTKPKLPWTVRMIVNLLRGYIDDYVSRMTASQPNFDVTPFTGSIDDEADAFVGSRIGRWAWATEGMRRKIIQAMTLTGITGNSFIGSRWNPKSGRLVDRSLLETGSAQRPVADFSSRSALDRTFGDGSSKELGRPGVSDRNAERNLQHLGDPEAEVIAHYQITEDPAAHDLDDAQWVMVTHERTITWVRMNFGKQLAAKLSPDMKNAWPLDYVSGQGIDVDSSLFPRRTTEAEVTRPNTVLIHTLFRRGDDRWKRGTYAVAAQGHPLQNPIDNPSNSKHLQIPLIHLGFSWVPGQFWYGTPTTDALNLQMYLNRIHSAMMETANLTGNPIMVAAKRAKVLWANFTGQPGTWLEYDNQGGTVKAPDYMKPPEFPIYARMIPEWIRGYMDDLFADHKVAQGKATSEAKSGVAIRLLQEASASRHGAQRDRMEHAIGIFGSQQLALIAENMKDERTFAIMGEDGQRSFSLWSSKSFSKEPFRDFDVTANMFTRIAHTQLGIREDIRNLTDMGWLRTDNPEHVQLVHRLVGLGGVGLHVDAKSREARAEAFQEHQQLTEGSANPESMFRSMNDPNFSMMERPKSGQKHAVHRETHEGYKLTDEYRRLDEEAKAALDEHIMGHHEQEALDIFRPMAIRQMVLQGLGVGVPQDPNQKPSGSNGASSSAARKPQPTASPRPQGVPTR